MGLMCLLKACFWVLRLQSGKQLGSLQMAPAARGCCWGSSRAGLWSSNGKPLGRGPLEVESLTMEDAYSSTLE